MGHVPAKGEQPMPVKLITSAVFVVTFILILVDRPLRAQSVHVIDMIPASLSQETNNDAEPFLAVNPANPLILIATPFMPTGPGPNGPILVSFDGGNTWVVRN